MNGMRFGVQLPEVEREVSWREMRDIACTAEESGFDSVWVGDHLLYRRSDGPRGPLEAWSVLAGLAEATERVQIGPLVAATSFHNPAMLAKKAATVDEMSGGRLILGLGAGWNRVEYEAYGFPYDNRVSRFEEAFTIIRTLIRDGAIDFVGRFHTLRDCVLVPAARPSIPLLIGSNGPRMLRIAAPHVAMWNTWYASYGNRAPGLARLQLVVDEACRDVGRDPATMARTAAVLVQLHGGSGRTTSPDHPVVAPIAGSRQQLAEELAAFSAAGIDHLQLVIDPITSASVAEVGETLTLLRR
jgi:alkanesulfonate monooxygenase SsuD/methylene tetrahydromethanopterin reductase-like flavin-dependent oxidoreductase (luciferase family)